MRRFITGLALAALLWPAAASAQTAAPTQTQVPSIRDITELTRAGVDDEVILALIEVHRPVYPVDAATLKQLKSAGISSAVIVAMVKSGRTQPPAAAEAPVAEPVAAEPVAPTPQVVVVEHERPRESEVRQIAVPYPVYVPVRVRDHDDKPRPKPEPVYWGWGGKLRPDAWKPLDVKDVQKDAKIPPAQKK